jgi:hypothetical protein
LDTCRTKSAASLNSGKGTIVCRSSRRSQDQQALAEIPVGDWTSSEWRQVSDASSGGRESPGRRAEIRNGIERVSRLALTGLEDRNVGQVRFEIAQVSPSMLIGTCILNLPSACLYGTENRKAGTCFHRGKLRSAMYLETYCSGALLHKVLLWIKFGRIDTWRP